MADSSGSTAAMWLRRLAIVVFSFASVTAVSARAGANEVDQVRQDVTALMQALYGGDVETLLKYTHPTIIEMMHGPQAARVALQKVIAETRRQAITQESLTFAAPPEFFAAGGRRFAVIPFVQVLDVAGTRYENRNYQLGVLEPAASQWTYVEGSRITAEKAQALFPRFPADRRFPPIASRQLGAAN